MKLKHLSLAFLVGGILSSCVSDDLDTSFSADRDGMPSTLSIKLNSGKVETRATIDIADYTHATPEELYIGKCAIAIFNITDEGPGTLMAYKYVTLGDADFTTGYTEQTEPNDTTAYIVNNIPITTGMAHIVAIANLDESDTEAGIPHQIGTTTYADFTALVKTTLFDNTFDPANLIKVGELTVNLQTKDQVIEVPLTQLAARVDFTLTVGFTPQDLPVKVKYPEDTENILSMFDKDLQSFSQNKMPDVTDEKAVQHIIYNGVKYYAFNCEINGATPHFGSTGNYINPFFGVVADSRINHTETASGLTTGAMKVLEVGPVDPTAANAIGIDSVFSKARWAFYIKTATVNNIQTKTDVVIQGSNSQESTKEHRIYEHNDTVFDAYSLSFYTYETFQSSEDLTIQIDGLLINGIETTTRHYNATLHGLWVYGKTPPKPDYYPGQSHGGWGSANDVFATLLADGSLSGTDTVFVKTEQIDIAKRYRVKVNTTDILHGHMYDLYAKMDDTFLPQSLTKAGNTYSPTAGPAAIEDFILQSNAMTPWR